MSITCVAASLAAAEPLAGTAVERVTTWLLVEVRDAWGRKGLEDTPMPELLRQRIGQATAGRPWLRPQLIRRPAAAGPLVALVVRSGGADESVEQLLVEDLEALSHVPLERWVDGELPPGAIHRGQTPLVLVCAHGKRDRCCAEHGVALYKALDGLLGDCVWQSSHLNGHRFAATAVVFPGGWQYGRLEADDAPGLAEAIAHHHLYRLDRARGRTSATCVEQAAEIAWRTAESEVELRRPALETHTTEQGLQVLINDTRWEVQGQPSPSAFTASCGAEASTPQRWLARRLPIG